MFSMWSIDGVRSRFDWRRVGRVRASSASAEMRTGADGGDGTGASALNPERVRRRNPYAEAQERQQLPVRREEALTAGQVMTAEVITLSSGDPIDRAWTLFKARMFRHIPVVASDGRLVGMLSDRGMLVRAASPGGGGRRGALGSRVQDVMTRNVISAHPDAPIREVARVMVESRVGAMPIVDEDDVLVGMVTRSDILRLLVNKASLELWI